MRLRECMMTNPIAVQVGMRLADAYELMTRHSMRHLPVVDHGRRYLGVIQRRDIDVARREGDGGLPDRGVLGLMELGTPTLDDEQSIEDAWELLSRSPGLNPLAVLREGNLVGTVSQHELLRAMAGLPRKESRLSEASIPTFREWTPRRVAGDAGLAAERSVDGGNLV